MAFDDHSEVEHRAEKEKLEPGEDTPHDALDDITVDEIEAGEFLGTAIDVDADDDDGAAWGTVESPTMTAKDFEELG